MLIVPGTFDDYSQNELESFKNRIRDEIIQLNEQARQINYAISQRKYKPGKTLCKK